MANDNILDLESVADCALEGLEELRVELLAYDAKHDRSGMVWDALRVDLDRRVLTLLGLVLMLAPKREQKGESNELAAG